MSDENLKASVIEASDFDAGLQFRQDIYDLYIKYLERVHLLNSDERECFVSYFHAIGRPAIISYDGGPINIDLQTHPVNLRGNNENTTTDSSN